MVKLRITRKTNNWQKILRKLGVPTLIVVSLLALAFKSVPNVSSTIATKETKESQTISESKTQQDPEKTKVKSQKTISEYDLNESERSEVTTNTEIMSKWANKFQQSCDKFSTTKEITSFAESLVVDGSSWVNDAPKPARGVKRCKNVFLDFGSNIGDSIGKFVDANFLSCKKGNEGARYDVTTRKFVAGEYNRISDSFKKAADASGFSPHEFCLYGVEGNPTFTDRLQKMEESIMSMTPRPVQNVHLLTEHVGMGVDGPTKLYLDTVNTKENFWGSSVLQSHQDVQKSIKEGETNEVTAADVMGITLTTLMERTLLAFSPDATPEDKKGGSLIVKVDIEGGEYDLMAEAAESLRLCEYKAMGNDVILIVEYHFNSITDINERRPRLQKKDEVKAKLAECGVEMTKMSANWA